MNTKIKKNYILEFIVVIIYSKLDPAKLYMNVILYKYIAFNN